MSVKNHVRWASLSLPPNEKAINFVHIPTIQPQPIFFLFVFYLWILALWVLSLASNGFKRFKVHQVCDCGRWGCGEDLYAYLLHQQQVSHCMFFFSAKKIHLGLSNLTSLCDFWVFWITFFFSVNNYFMRLCIWACSFFCCFQDFSPKSLSLDKLLCFFSLSLSLSKIWFFFQLFLCWSGLYTNCVWQLQCKCGGWRHHCELRLMGHCWYDIFELSPTQIIISSYIIVFIVLVFVCL